MRSLRYLNGVLTVLAVLLTLNLWGQWHSAPDATLPAVDRAHAQGRANPAQQRMEMIGQLKKVNKQLGSISDRLDKPFEVEVANKGEQ
jgi:hypothetical protein